MQSGKGLGQLQHSMNNMFLESATMPPNVKDILNRRGEAIVNSIKIGRTPVQSAIQRNIKNIINSQLRSIISLIHGFQYK